MRSTDTPWWRDAVIYQVYPRSFADSDGDGVGDVPGIRSRLTYLHRLGVDAIWLSPFYPSPQADAGYDVADYRDVEPMFGTLADFDALVTEAHALDIRVIIDIVPNHTSDAHPWFRAALAAGPGSPERARYLFRDGRGPDGGEPPNDWTSVFGGGAWERVADADGTPGQWYLHLFDTKQPDLDWTNDEVVAEFESILRFWLDRGVDGFRIDVAHGLAKDPEMPDIDGRFVASGQARLGHPHWDQDAVHDVYRGWRRVIDEYPGDRAFVGEIWVESNKRVADYLRPDELHTAFNFHFLQADWSASSQRAAIDESIETTARVGAPVTWVLSNHDVIRHVTRYGAGDLTRGTRRARAATLLMLALPGSAYLYQGEELGLPEVVDLPAAARQDPMFARTGGAELGRDGCRVPLPWSGERSPFGFGPGPTTWLPQPGSWATLTAESQQADRGSTWSLYRRALAERRRHPALGDGTMNWVDAPVGVLAFTREPGFACVTNTTDRPQTVPTALAGELLLASDPDATATEVPADGTVWLAI
ncbi:MAG: glycoside hydrolase family 13 protein [Desertimonas sp.]